MVLSDLERLIIVTSQLQADASCAAIAKACNCREHSVRSTLRKLEQSGIIKQYPFINVHSLGFENFVCNFSLNPASKVAPQLVQALGDSEHTSWLSKRTGDFQWAASLFLANSSEMVSFMDRLTTPFLNSFQTKEVVIHTSCHLFPRKYLCKAAVEPRHLYYGRLEQRASIDEVDHKILAALSKLSPCTGAIVARTAGIPEATVAYRIKSLQERGVISGFAYAFYPQALALFAHRFLVSLKGFSAQLRNDIFEFCRDHPNIVSLISSIGNWDYEIKIEGSSEEQIDGVLSEFSSRFSEFILATKTFSLMKAQKILYYPFRNFTTALGASLRAANSDVKLQQNS